MKRELVLNGNPMEEIVGFARAVRVGPYIVRLSVVRVFKTDTFFR